MFRGDRNVDTRHCSMAPKQTDTLDHRGSPLPGTYHRGRQLFERQHGMIESYEEHNITRGSNEEIAGHPQIEGNQLNNEYCMAEHFKGQLVQTYQEPDRSQDVEVCSNLRKQHMFKAREYMNVQNGPVLSSLTSNKVEMMLSPKYETRDISVYQSRNASTPAQSRDTVDHSRDLSNPGHSRGTLDSVNFERKDGYQPYIPNSTIHDGYDKYGHSYQSNIRKGEIEYNKDYTHQMLLATCEEQITNQSNDHVKGENLLISQNCERDYLDMKTSFLNQARYGRSSESASGIPVDNKDRQDKEHHIESLAINQSLPKELTYRNNSKDNTDSIEAEDGSANSEEDKERKDTQNVGLHSDYVGASKDTLEQMKVLSPLTVATEFPCPAEKMEAPLSPYVQTDLHSVKSPLIVNFPFTENMDAQDIMKKKQWLTKLVHDAIQNDEQGCESQSLKPFPLQDPPKCRVKRQMSAESTESRDSITKNPPKRVQWSQSVDTSQNQSIMFEKLGQDTRTSATEEGFEKPPQRFTKEHEQSHCANTVVDTQNVNAKPGRIVSENEHTFSENMNEESTDGQSKVPKEENVYLQTSQQSLPVHQEIKYSSVVKPYAANVKWLITENPGVNFEEVNKAVDDKSLDTPSRTQYYDANIRNSSRFDHRLNSSKNEQGLHVLKNVATTSSSSPIHVPDRNISRTIDEVDALKPTHEGRNICERSNMYLNTNHNQSQMCAPVSSLTHNRHVDYPHEKTAFNEKNELIQNQTYMQNCNRYGNESADTNQSVDFRKGYNYQSRDAIPNSTASVSTNSDYVNSKGFIFPAKATITEPILLSPRIVQATERPVFSKPPTGYKAKQQTFLNEKLRPNVRPPTLQNEAHREAMAYKQRMTRRSNSDIDHSPSKLEIEVMKKIVDKLNRSLSDPSGISPNKKEMLYEEKVRENFSLRGAPSDEDVFLGEMFSGQFDNSDKRHEEQFRDWLAYEEMLNKRERIESTSNQQSMMYSPSDSVKRRLFSEQTRQNMYESDGRRGGRPKNVINEKIAAFLLSKNICTPDDINSFNNRSNSPTYSDQPPRDMYDYTRQYPTSSPLEDRFDDHNRQNNSSQSRVGNDMAASRLQVPQEHMVFRTPSPNRRRQRGEIDVRLTCTDLCDKTKNLQENLKQVDHGGKNCACANVENSILQLARDAYQKIRRHDGTTKSFQQFENELQETNLKIYDAMNVLCSIKALCKHGRSISDIFTGSVVFRVLCPSASALDDLWTLCRTGELQTMMNKDFVTNEMRKNNSNIDIHLVIHISESQYRQTRLSYSSVKSSPRLDTSLSRSDTELSSILGDEDQENSDNIHMKRKSSTPSVIHIRSHSAPISQLPSPIARLHRSPRSPKSPGSPSWGRSPGSPRDKERRFAFPEQSPRRAFQEINRGKDIPCSPTMKKLFDFDINLSPKTSPKRKTFAESFPWDDENTACLKSPKRKNVGSAQAMKE